MLIRESESIKLENSKDCTVWEYEFPSKDFSFATAYINGRYPEEKRVTNLECEETYYVISGSWYIHSENWNYEINKWDLYFFEKGEIYWTEWDNLLLALVNAPKWSPDQHKIVE